MSITRRRRRKRNPETAEKSWLPWLVGAGTAIAATYGAYRMFTGEDAPAQQPQVQHAAAPVDPIAANMAAFQQRYAQQQPVQYGQPMAGMMGMGGRNHNGIPEIPLPPESAARTAQARRFQAPPPPPPALAGGGGGGAIPTESFGGGEDGGATMGGEKF